jgi:aminoglycoside phosphotransferase (APT) family kinase protein
VEPSDQFLDLLRRDGLAKATDTRLIPLSGGVSSEIYLVEDGDDRYVVKRALAKLKVKDDWFADVRRNASEYRFIQHVSKFLPNAVPRPRAVHDAAGYFAMEFLGEGFENWKQLLLTQRCDVAHAKAAGELLASLQQNTWHDELVRSDFETTENFRQLRIEPYLLTTADRNPDLAGPLREEAQRLENTCECLVHGDFSPKNILIHPSRMVLVDCEVAWFGDPSFDPAFLLSHLLLKALLHAPKEVGIAEMVTAFWDRFSTSPANQSDAAFESRIVRLMLMLMLARVEGKSKVEYLEPSKANIVRVFVRRALAEEQTSLKSVMSMWNATLFDPARKPS